MRSYWLFAALVLSGILASANAIAMSTYLYWRYVWFDVPMHFLGGVTIAVFLIGFLFRFRPRLFVVLFALIAVGWEVFEYCFGIPREANYVFDTAVDLLMDTLGAVLVYGIARLSVWR